MKNLHGIARCDAVSAQEKGTRNIGTGLAYCGLDGEPGFGIIIHKVASQ